MTSYTRLRAKLESPLYGHRKYMFITTSSNGNNFDDTDDSTNSPFPVYKHFTQTTHGKINLDLSGINGWYYIGFGMAYNAHLAVAYPPIRITISELELL